MPELPGLAPGGPAPQSMNAPQAGPMAIPSPQQGKQMKAQVDIQTFISGLLRILNEGLFPPSSKEFNSLHSAIGSLSKAFGGMESSKDLTMGGIKNMLDSISPKGLGGVQQPGGGAPAAPGMTPGMPKPNPLQFLQGLGGGGMGGM